MYVADAESNIIRAIDLPPANRVRTLAGGDLFEFGDVDGKGDAVRLQHPLGLAMHDGRVVIADTYNHKIKLLDPATGKVWTLAGTGTPGHADGKGRKAQFYEPGGVSVSATRFSSPTRTITPSRASMPKRERRGRYWCDDSADVLQC